MAEFLSFFAISRSRKSQLQEELSDWWPWLAFGVVLLALCLGWLLLPLRQWMDALQSSLLGLGLWGVVIFTLILTVATFLPLPDWPLPIVAGYVFGVWAFPLVYFAIAVPSAFAFLAARHLAREPIRAYLARHPKYKAVDRAVTKDGWQVVVLLRLSPIVPFNLQNYALGMTAIPFWRYIGATLVGIVPGIVIYVYFGIFGQGLGRGATVLDWVFLALGVIATITLGVVVSRKTKTMLSETKASRRR